jgi:hypothetical protein
LFVVSNTAAEADQQNDVSRAVDTSSRGSRETGCGNGMDWQQEREIVTRCDACEKIKGGAAGKTRAGKGERTVPSRGTGKKTDARG